MRETLSAHIEEIHVTRISGKARCAATAKFLPASSQWEIKVLDHHGEQTKDVFDNPWTGLEEMVAGAVATSVAKIKEVEGAES